VDKKSFFKMISATFIQRLNRFAASVSIDGKPETVHIPNSGRLRELLTPGSEVLLSPSSNAKRKTGYTLKAVRQGYTWVSIDSTLVNDVIEDTLRSGKLPMFAGLKRSRDICCEMQGSKRYPGS
jgi:sugar fermentation stimulation protein A